MRKCTGNRTLGRHMIQKKSAGTRRNLYVPVAVWELKCQGSNVLGDQRMRRLLCHFIRKLHREDRTRGEMGAVCTEETVQTVV